MAEREPPREFPALSVGHVRRLIKDLPDDAGFFPVWASDPPGDHEPGVQVCGFNPGTDRNGRPGVKILVALFYLDEIADGGEDGDEDLELTDDDLTDLVPGQKLSVFNSDAGEWVPAVFAGYSLVKDGPRQVYNLKDCPVKWCYAAEIRLIPPEEPDTGASRV